MDLRDKIWLNIYQIQQVEKMIEEKNEKIINIDSEDFDTTNDFNNRSIELEKIINEIIDEFQKLHFDKIPSVEVDKITTKIEETIEAYKIEKYSNISLLEHTQNVINFIKSSKENFNPNEYEYLILFALLHDAGKSKRLRLKYNINEEYKHELVSAIYAKQKLKNTSFEHIGEALYIYTKQQKENYILKSIYKKFHEIDENVRILELKKQVKEK